MIDPLVEELITPTEATALYPRGPRGKKVDVSRVYRDMQLGCRGIRLESIRTPRLATSRQAVARYFLALSEAARPQGSAATSSPRPRRGAEAVDRELDLLGF